MKRTFFRADFTLQNVYRMAINGRLKLPNFGKKNGLETGRKFMAKSYDVVLWTSFYITSQSFVHNTTSSGHVTWYFQSAIQITFLRAKWDNFRALISLIICTLIIFIMI